MNERQAIQWILEELKEQRKQDFEMYFEMRKQTSMRYEALLNRLRFIDEKDRMMNAVETLPEPEKKMEPIHAYKELPKSEGEDHLIRKHLEQVRDNGIQNLPDVVKDMPEPKNPDATPTSLMVERVDEDEEEDIPVIDIEEEDEGTEVMEDDELQHATIVRQPLPSGYAYQGKPNFLDVVEYIEEYLKQHAKKSYRTAQLQRLVERHFNAKWANFSSVMVRVMDLSNHIKNIGRGRVMHFQYKT